MAFLIKGNSFAQLRSHTQKGDDLLSTSRRGLHVAPGPREQALLAKDPALSRFKSYKKSVKTLKRVGDVLTVVVVAAMQIVTRGEPQWKWYSVVLLLWGICYEIYVKATMREEAREKARKSN